MANFRKVGPQQRLWLSLWCFLFVAKASAATAFVVNPNRAETDFFESRIRPILTEQCYSCHSLEAEKVKGGLLLDSQEGIWKGGESGPAIVPGDPDKSRLILGVRYTDKDLQMPPKQMLSASQIKDLEEWVRMGAPDPRKQKARSIKVSTNFWAFRALRPPAIPRVKNKRWAAQNLDYFVLARLEEKKLAPSPPADKASWLRRVSFDLIGLPPSAEEIAGFLRDDSSEAYGKAVDRLLGSKHFGERWGRHWLDVARYADSNGLEFNTPYPNAWRYRDYVIAAFNKDKPFNRFIQEQIAGDLLPTQSETNDFESMIATGFLMLGPKNLNEPDRDKRLMDVVDEQIDVTSKAFLGFTIACARCHDHKFDPIPTRDYYALAGIFRSCNTLVDDRSRGFGPAATPWVERPLGSQEQAREIEKFAAKVSEMQADLDQARQTRANLPGGIDSKLLPGMVIDNLAAELKGDWKTSMYSTNFVDQNYVQDGDEGKGRKSIRFVPKITKAGYYEVRVSYTPRENRATNVPVTVESREGKKTVLLNQRLPPSGSKGFASIGTFDFALGTNGSVTIGNQGTKGFVVADAVQFLPADAMEMNMMAMKAPDEAKSGPMKFLTEDQQESLAQEISDLQRKAPPPLPSAMAIKEGKPRNCKIHIRGDPQKLGDEVVRGSLASFATELKCSEDQSGRLELAEWIASPQNPLTARVFVNRVWVHLFGRGIVATPDNFGAMGELPSNQDLLDHLASNFIEHGWSVKALIREICLSSTYRLSVEASPAAAARDPENILLSHMNRRRLEVEPFRDAILAISGRLDSQSGGPPLDNPTRMLPRPMGENDFKSLRRSVYLPVLRNDLPDMFQAFDAPDPHTVSGKRHSTTAATQALFVLNSPFMMEEAKAWADRLLQASGSDTDRIALSYKQAFGRAPRSDETERALRFLKAYETALAKRGKDDVKVKIWQAYAQALFASAEFRYLN